MRVLITGVSGFVGSHLVEDLIRSGFEVFGIAEIEARRLLEESLWDKISFFPCDICDSRRLGEILQEVRPDQIFHLAGVSFLPQADTNPERVFWVNFHGTLSLYEAVRKSTFSPKILFVGSAQEYGLAFKEGKPVNEDCLLKPVDSYSSSKAAADLLSFQYFYGFGLKIVRVRPFNHTGPGQSEQFACSSFAKQIVEIEFGRKEAKLYVGNLEVKRDFVDVRDVVRAYGLALGNGKIGEVYNICSEKSMSVREILTFLLKHSRKPIEVIQDLGRRRGLEVPEMFGDCRKFKADTGWQSTIPLEQTLEDLLNYWRKVLSSSSGVGS